MLTSSAAIEGARLFSQHYNVYRLAAGFEDLARLPEADRDPGNR